MARKFEGRLCLAFDATYLTSTLAQMQLRGRRGMVGGMWYPDAEEEIENSFVPLEGDNVDISKAHKCVGKEGTCNSLDMFEYIWQT